MKNPRPVILSSEEMVASTLTASCLYSREETMKKVFQKKNSRSCQTNFQQSVRIPTSIVDRNPRSSLAIANSSFCGGGTADPAAI
jgi:hypothetical protein